MRPTRRAVLGGATSLATAGLAGCTADDARHTDRGAFTAFYTLETFTRQTAGGAMPVQNPVPTGEMGHRYAVGSQAQVEAARSNVFVFLDLVGFQDWALETATNLRRHHPDVAVIDALDGVGLRDAGRGHGDEPEQDGQARRESGAHRGVDPHYWLDPIRAAESVGTIADGLKRADPSNAETYESNAVAYRDELDSLDGTYRDELADRALETVVVAGHDSYQYLAERYGFDVHSPVGLSPNAEPGSAEIADTIALVNDRGIDAVLYDAFASPRLAETIVRESDATDVVAVSPVSGIKREWAGRDWGYVEQMKEINLPALKTALNADD